jgi:hypothetical protein
VEEEQEEEEEEEEEMVYVHTGIYVYICILPRVVLIAGRPTLQTPRRSPGVYRNLEPSIARASFRVP